jgi:hypothetical protein
MSKATHTSGKVKQARKLAASLVSDFDFDMYFDQHPNEVNALNALLDDIDAAPQPDDD